VQLGLGVAADRLVRVIEARLDVEPRVPAAPGVAGDGDRALVERPGVVEKLGEVEICDGAPAFAARAHAARAGEGRSYGLAVTALHCDRTTRPDRGDVERERVGRADVRLPEPAEQDPQHRVGVGGRADRRPRVGPHPLLIDAERGRQPVKHVDLGPRQRRHEALHEGAVGLVDQPLRLGGDRVENQRALARAGDAGEHRQPALRDLDADVLEVVLARAVHADQVMAVSNVPHRRLPLRPHGHCHRSHLPGRPGSPARLATAP
jgi:hypothetical protein